MIRVTFECHMTYSFTQTYHRPKWASQCTTTANAAAQKPLNANCNRTKKGKNGFVKGRALLISIQLQKVQQYTLYRWTYFNGNDFFRILLTRPMVAWNSSGATRDLSSLGKFVLKLLLNPNLEISNWKLVRKKAENMIRWNGSQFKVTNETIEVVEKCHTYTVILPVPRIMIGSTFGTAFGNGCSSSIWYIASKSAMANNVDFQFVYVSKSTTTNVFFFFFFYFSGENSQPEFVRSSFVIMFSFRSFYFSAVVLCSSSTNQ